MRSFAQIISLSIFVLSLAWQTGSEAAESSVYHGRSKAVEARLLSNWVEIDPSTDEIWFALELVLDPGWYSYWKNAGDVGYPPKINWQLPPGWTADEILYPIPDRHPAPGEVELTSFGYHDRVLYLIRTQGPEIPKDTFKARAEVDFLVCEKICVPERADLLVEIPVTDNALESDWSLDIEEALVQLPQEVENFVVEWESSERFRLKLFEVRSEELFLSSGDVQKNFWSAKKVEEDEVSETWEIELDQPRSPIEVTTSYGAGIAKTGVKALVESRPLFVLEASFWLSLLFAFLGGMILNLMPCVLPVVFLKTNSLLKLRGKGEAIQSSLLLTIAGILASFLVLAAVTIFIQSLGEQVGWGFQFQSPGFVSFMLFVIFLFALNLWGLFEVQLPSKLNTKMGNQGGAFFEGVFATLLATPCSAPFLGAGLAFALSQSAPVLILFFLVMGLGLSTPYFIFLASPKLIELLPKPGAWMERLKRILAYSLMLAVLWLAYVLNQQTSSIVLFLVMSCFLLLVIFLKEMRSCWRWLAVALIVIFGVLWSERFSLDRLQAKAALEERVIPFNEAEFWDRLEAGDRIFLNITADWCLTCKYNEATVLKTDWFQNLLREEGIYYMEADWTRRDPQIGVFLERFNRVGIPFSGYFSKEQTEILPELLTRANTEAGLESFRKLGSDRQEKP